jgi:hypothetical protein
MGLNCKGLLMPEYEVKQTGMGDLDSLWAASRTGGIDYIGEVFSAHRPLEWDYEKIRSSRFIRIQDLPFAGG